MTKDNKTNIEKTPSVNDDLFNAGNASDFFQSLDDNKSNQVTPEKSSPDSGNDAGGKGSDKSVEDQIAELRNEIKTTEKRYGDSSKEAINLRTQMNELEPFIPIFDEMKGNPALVKTMQNAIEAEKAPKAPKEALGLADDFIFDAEEAMTDLNSDSAKVMRYMGRIEADARAKETEVSNSRIRASEKQERDFDDFVSKSKLSDDDTQDFKKFMSEHELSLDDVYFLMRRNDITKGIAEKARAETLKQIQSAQMLNGDSLGSRESVMLDTKNDDKFFDKVFGEREKGIFG
ncbi:MAG: hypothetical protein H8D23_18365 [Candidatus Brocadiales bacterium]|nr:hypothetical protein [Candidatus Brocadiales bacterium]